MTADYRETNNPVYLLHPSSRTFVPVTRADGVIAPLEPRSAEGMALAEWLAAGNVPDPIPPPEPAPPKPDYGTDVPDDYLFQQHVQAITNLRQYLQVATPTAAQSTAALKTLIRVVLYREKQMDGG